MGDKYLRESGRGCGWTHGRREDQGHDERARKQSIQRKYRNLFGLVADWLGRKNHVKIDC